MTDFGGGEGTLSMVVWPAYVGLATIDAEPLFHVEYQRGQINWQIMPNDEIVGTAKVIVPAGEYVELHYFQHPESLLLTGRVVLPHPLRMPALSTVTIDPITSGDLIVAGMNVTAGGLYG